MSEIETADSIADEILKDEKVKRIVEEARLFDGLKEHQGWQRLYERIAAHKDKFMAGIARRLVTPGAKPPEPEEIAYYQGFWQGAVWVISHPALAEENLERAARMAWAMKLEETIEQEESPYA
jgi:hypothetical protein